MKWNFPQSWCPDLNQMSAVILMVMGWQSWQNQGSRKLQTSVAVQKVFRSFISQWCCFPESVNYKGSDSLNCLSHYWFCSQTRLYQDWLFSYEFRDAIRLRAVLCCYSWRWREIITMYLSLIGQENCYYKRVKRQQSSGIITSFLSSEEIFYNEDHICMGWLHDVCVSCSTWFLRLFC